MKAMNRRVVSRISGWTRVTHLSALALFLAGSQHCVLAGLAGRSCDAAPVVASAAAAVAEHDCCAPNRAHAPAVPKSDARSACCVEPAPLPAAATVSAPPVTPAPLALVSATPVASHAAAPRIFARPPERGSPPVRPAPEPGLGRAPPLA